ncbi:ABC transporter ATP-binding protein [Companilactobacillus kimchiensis]|uniref:Nitrate transport ATP-binding protein nrtD n=1 Tax=Companilactobacillus kimchiensis TaxID=993692 RepID=A0A0R2LDK4_9LACO|nr:ABC transporter ATP-binding protein [Companilactobacillus kimchiensis]KRO00053.1 nitrate transport ATP-binding protein nrtD [Companilactobacillus kimchiensis]
MELVRAENLSIKYPNSDETVIKDTNFTIADNEIFVLVGPSGCGKSTILQALAGFIQADGLLTMNNETITGPDWRRGVVFQNSSLYPWFTVKENVGFGLKARKFSSVEIDQRVKYLLDLIGLSNQNNMKTFELSGGMRQRVAIARVLANKSPLLLMDEPFGALDAFTRAKMQKLILDIWQQEKTSIFMITHDLNEAIRCGNKIAIMNAHDKKITKIQDNPFQNINLEELNDFELEKKIDNYRKDILKLINK